ncbi:hypothetical protein GWK47_004055 [Chionoecetes opilio]|uniref:Uncharacterized protein n=1 Tax=Chionoecetes opilio TaxID=41210 RepID=A0A8J5CZL0_CHIOP|nr:hypothetical protein GWK47_004055 [Chionoecetes opilio]
MSWEGILGPRQRLGLCLSQDHLHILKASYGSTSDRSSTGTARAEASMDFVGGREVYGSDHSPCVCPQRPATVEYIGGVPSFWRKQLDRKVFYLTCRHHILEVLVGAVGENLFGKVKSPENPLVQALQGRLDRSYHRQPYNPVHQTKWLNKKKKE